MSRTRGLLFIGCALGAVAAIVIAATVTGDASARKIRKAGVIRIGYAVEAPYAFPMPDGEVTGESPEVARRIVARLGIPRIEWRQVDFDELIPELEAGRIDLIAAGMFITPERARRVGFSTPTFHVTQGLLVREGNPKGIHSYRQAAAHADARIAVLSGSAEQRVLRELGMPDDRIVVVPDARTGRVAIEAGVADGLALSSPTVRWMAAQSPSGKIEAALPFQEVTPKGPAGWGIGAFAFRTKDRRLRQLWDAALKPFIGSSEHLKLISPFGFTESELPSPFTSAEAPER